MNLPLSINRPKGMPSSMDPNPKGQAIRDGKKVKGQKVRDIVQKIKHGSMKRSFDPRID